MAQGSKDAAAIPSYLVELAGIERTVLERVVESERQAELVIAEERRAASEMIAALPEKLQRERREIVAQAQRDGERFAEQIQQRAAQRCAQIEQGFEAMADDWVATLCEEILPRKERLEHHP